MEFALRESRRAIPGSKEDPETQLLLFWKAFQTDLRNLSPVGSWLGGNERVSARALDNLTTSLGLFRVSHIAD